MFGIFAAVNLSAGEHEGEGGGMEAQMPPMGPPEEIKMCEPMIGNWHFEGEYRMDPSQEWTPIEAEVSIKYMFDGGMVEMTWDSEMMGMEMHGLSHIAYNRYTHEWQQTWMDNLFNAVSLYTGEVTPEKMVFAGSDMMDGQEMFSRTTSSDFAADSFKWVMEHSMDGQNYFVGMQGTYTRK